MAFWLKGTGCHEEEKGIGKGGRTEGGRKGGGREGGGTVIASDDLVDKDVSFLSADDEQLT